MGSEIIATALEQLAYAIKEYPLHSQIKITTYINPSDKPSAEVIFQFSAKKNAKAIKFLEVEIDLWRSESSAVTLLLEVSSAETGKRILHEAVNLQHLDDAYPYFEKALDFFNLEETE